MSANMMTGFCRVTIVAPTMRVDVALPEDVALADLLPDIVRLGDQSQAEYAYAGFILSRLGGPVLDTSLSLGDQGVRSGDLLFLRPLAEQAPPVVYDEVVDAVASSVENSQPMWSSRGLRVVCLAVGASVLAVSAVVLALSTGIHGPPAVAAAALAVVVLLVGAARSRVYGDHAGAAVLLAAVLPHVFLAGLGALAPTAAASAPTAVGAPSPVPVPAVPAAGVLHLAGLGRTQLLAGLVAVLVFSVLAGVVLGGSRATFIGAAVAGGIGSIATFIAVLSQATPVQTSAITATATLALIGFLPNVAVRAARLPAPTMMNAEDPVQESGAEEEPVEIDRIAMMARRGHETLTGLAGACASVLLVCASVLGFSTSAWARAFAVVLGLAMLVRARLFRQSRQVVLMAVGGLASVAVVLFSLAYHASTSARLDWGFGVIVVAGLFVVTIGLLVPGRTFSPMWGRLLDLTESLLLISVIPVCLQVINLYSVARDFTA